MEQQARLRRFHAAVDAVESGVTDHMIRRAGFRGDHV